MIATTKVKKNRSGIRHRNAIVQYKGGGYDGCMYEWNYAYFDAEGEFHSIVATGYRGCRTKAELREFLAATGPNDFDVYRLNRTGEIERFGRETPISHLLTVATWFHDEGFDVGLTAVCDVCGKTVPVVDCQGEGLHGVGGIAMQYDKIICAECESQGRCAYCGEYVGAERINRDTGYCTGSDHGQRWCHERHPT